MSCCAAGRNGRLDLRRRAFPLAAQVSAEWSRCPGSVARRARDNAAPLLRSSAGWMPARMGRLSAGVGRRHPVTIRNASLMTGKWGRCEHYGTRQERSTLRFNRLRLRWLFAVLFPQHPSQSQQATSRVRRVMSAFCKVTRGVGDTWVSCPTLLQGIWAHRKRAEFHRWNWLSAHI